MGKTGYSISLNFTFCIFGFAVLPFFFSADMVGFAFGAPAHGSGETVLMILEKDNAITSWRSFMGPTNSIKVQYISLYVH